MSCALSLRPPFSPTHLPWVLPISCPRMKTGGLLSQAGQRHPLPPCQLCGGSRQGGLHDCSNSALVGVQACYTASAKIPLFPLPSPSPSLQLPYPPPLPYPSKQNSTPVAHAAGERGLRWTSWRGNAYDLPTRGMRSTRQMTCSDKGQASLSVWKRGKRLDFWRRTTEIAVVAVAMRTSEMPVFSTSFSIYMYGVRIIALLGLYDNSVTNIV